MTFSSLQNGMEILCVTPFVRVTIFYIGVSVVLYKKEIVLCVYKCEF